MARTLNFDTVRLYRTVTRRLVANSGGSSWLTDVYGPHDNKNANRDYADCRFRDRAMEYHVMKQELKPVFNFTNDGNLQLGLEWVNYEVDGVKVDHVH